MDALLLERGDLAAIAAIDDVDLRIGVDLPHEPDAPRAEDAAVPVEHEGRTEIHVGTNAFAVEHPPREFHPALVRAETVGEVLERTLAALVAHGAVERVVDQQELEHAGARLDDVGGLGRDHHALGHRRRARRLQFRHLLDLDDADAAGPVDPQSRVIAVVGDLDAALDGGLQDGSALGGGDGAPVNRQRDGFHILRMIPKRTGLGRDFGGGGASSWGLTGDFRLSRVGNLAGARRGPVRRRRVERGPHGRASDADGIPSRTGRRMAHRRGVSLRHDCGRLAHRQGAPHAGACPRCLSAGPPPRHHDPRVDPGTRRLGAGAAIPRRQRDRIGETASAVAARLGRAAESGRQEVDRGNLGERLTRFYEYGGSRFILVFEPFERNGEPRVIGIYLP